MCWEHITPFREEAAIGADQASLLPPIYPQFWSLWHTFGAPLLTFTPLGATCVHPFAHVIAQVYFLWILVIPGVPHKTDAGMGGAPLGAR